MPTTDAGAADLLDVLASVQRSFATLLDEADLDAPVRACGTWTVTELALHLGGVHRWAAGMARGTDGDDVEPTGPRERTALLAFYREQADTLRATLRELGPDAPALTLVGPGPAAFWHRRQVHETLVHLHDLADAAGRPHPVDDPTLWADTVDEVVTVMAPRQVRLGRTDAPGRPVGLRATDGAAGRWLLDGLGPCGTLPRGAGSAVAPVEVAGPARSLALLLWGRTQVDDPALTVTGDRAVLDAVLARPLTP
ncbi:MAG TPA: maleylpyruvate isomerase family mycothiol-dependent enzyme [Cellulomonas sp.]